MTHGKWYHAVPLIFDRMGGQGAFVGIFAGENQYQRSTCASCDYRGILNCSEMVL